MAFQSQCAGQGGSLLRTVSLLATVLGHPKSPGPLASGDQGRPRGSQETRRADALASSLRERPGSWRARGAERLRLRRTRREERAEGAQEKDKKKRVEPEARARRGNAEDGVRQPAGLRRVK